MKKISLNVSGMTCSACSSGLEKFLKKQKGIINVNVNLILAIANIEYEDNLTISEIKAMIKKAGFDVNEEKETKERKSKEVVLLVVFGIILLVTMILETVLKRIDVVKMFENSNLIFAIAELIVSLSFIIYGMDIMKNGIKSLIHRLPNMDSLIFVAVLVNFIYSIYVFRLDFFNIDLLISKDKYFISSAMIIWIIKLGRLIDKRKKISAIETIKNLVTITPKYGYVLKDNEEKKVTIDEINKGDIVICKIGDIIPVDGKIVKGTTHTDESFITGESKPVLKEKGDNVIAGSINYDGYIEIEAERIGKNSSISNIIKLVVNATTTKAPISSFADKVCSYFVPSVFVIAIVVFALNLILTRGLYYALNMLVCVLVAACPCALGLATPLAMTVAINTAAKLGILIKSSEIIERMNLIDTIIFDKTGVLTKGKLTITDSSISNEHLMILKAMESKSNHPIAKSILNDISIPKLESEIDDFNVIAGYGISAKLDGKKYFAGNRKFVEKEKVTNNHLDKEMIYNTLNETIVYLFDEKETLGIIGLTDKINDSAKVLIENLKKENLDIIMLTGDNEDAAEEVANELKITDVISNAVPEDKMHAIEEYSKDNKCIMVGDGINDSLALKKAEIGISVHNGTDISADVADVILLKDDLNLINKLRTLSKVTLKIIKQNFTWAIIYNIIMLSIAGGLFGITINPMIASISMMISSLTVLFNSLRIKRIIK